MLRVVLRITVRHRFFPRREIGSRMGCGGGGGVGGGASLPLADLIYFPVRSVRLGRDQYKRRIEAVRLLIWF